MFFAIENFRIEVTIEKIQNITESSKCITKQKLMNQTVKECTDHMNFEAIKKLIESNFETIDSYGVPTWYGLGKLFA